MIRGFVGVAFALHLLIGNVCALGTAYAAQGNEPPMFSKEIPMSFNVVTCRWVETDEGWKPSERSPCANGHCFKEKEPDSSCVFAIAADSVTVHMPPPTPSADAEPFDADIPAPAPTESPPSFIGLRSTVLRI